MNSAASPEFGQMQNFKDRDIPLLEKRVDRLETSSICSEVSGGANMVFFAPPDRGLHTSSHSWTSPSQRMKNEFTRIERLVKRIAPEQFRNPARPSFGPCGIVPTTMVEYVEHTADILKLKTLQMEKNNAAKRENARVNSLKADGKTQPPITSKFGEGAKVFSDGLSPVLMRPTMWSIEYSQLQSVQPQWPTQTELQESGDKSGMTRKGRHGVRYLPPPRVRVQIPLWDAPNMRMDSLAQGYAIKILLPFDTPGMAVSYELPYSSTTIENSWMDDDPSFESTGRYLLGNALMEELGDRKAPFVPDWLVQRRRHQARQYMRTNAQIQATWPIQPMPHFC